MLDRIGRALEDSFCDALLAKDAPSPRPLPSPWRREMTAVDLVARPGETERTPEPPTAGEAIAAGGQGAFPRGDVLRTAPQGADVEPRVTLAIFSERLQSAAPLCLIEG